MFKKILIANRGEIACRVMRTARRLGIKSVAVFSDVDSQAQHRLQADESVHLPGNLPGETYLVIEKIIAAAKKTGADAIHPGYGFLSENAVFAQACADAGIAFIGPPAAAIAAMGSKSAAKRLMAASGVPLVPGYHGENQDDALLLKEAKQIGFPVLLKATAGGGGKGMRAVWSEAEFAGALAGARREAKNSFGDDTMLIEKYLQHPRHVEMQIFCDNHGQGVYLFERDCSIQRRHQKIVEEAPAPGMTAALRQRMGEAAVKAARAIDYAGAGTIEFLLDKSGEFYFMEMNTRLQVEHPVTEMITGQDLVEWQIRVAAGEKLPLTQAQLTINGHAIEVRICAEDTDNNFLPATGTLAVFRTPALSATVRLDTGVQEGDVISPFYDPMIAKLVCHGATRQAAAALLADALRDLRIAGIATNTAYLHRVIAGAPFMAADLDTRFLERHADALHADATQLPLATALAAVCSLRKTSPPGARQHAADPHSPWRADDAWEPVGTRQQPVAFYYQGNMMRVAVAKPAPGTTAATVYAGIDSQTLHVNYNPQEPSGALTWTATDAASPQPAPAWLHTVKHPVHGATQHLFLAGEQYIFQHPAASYFDTEETGHGCRAPMHGRIIAVLLKAGSRVVRGDPLLVMEAMKMEHQITAPGDGTVQAFHYAEGDIVDEGALLLDFAAAEADSA